MGAITKLLKSFVVLLKGLLLSLC